MCEKKNRLLVVIFLAMLLGCMPTPAPPLSPDLQAMGLEVTQSIQDLDNTVLLVADKRTFVRVYVTREKIDHVNPPYLTATLEGYRNGTSLGPPLLPSNTGGRIYITGEWDRRNLDDAFYFELPASWIQAGQITLKAIIDPSHEFSESDYGNNIINSTVLTFQPSKALKLRFVQYSFLRNNVRIAPSQFDLDEMISQLRRIYPIPQLNYQRFIVLANCGGGTNQISPSPCNSTYEDSLHKEQVPFTADVEAVLVGLRQSYEPNNPNALYFGLYALPRQYESYGPLGEAWWRDRAAVARTTAGSKVVDDINSNPGHEATHEIGHLLGRDHVNCSGSEGNTDPNYPISGGTIGGFPSHAMGFDSGDPGLDPSFKLRIIPPDWKDLMSYCDKPWISDYTYTGIFKYLQTASGVSMRESFKSVVLVRQALAARISPNAAESEYLSVYGTVDVAEQVASISFLARQSNRQEIPPREPGPYRILLLDKQDKHLADYAFMPNPGSSGETKLSFGQIIPFLPGTRRIAIYSDLAGHEIASVNVSANSPVISSFKIDSNADLLTSEPVSLSWAGVDQDGDLLTYTLLYSFDSAQSWRILATGLAGSSFFVDPSQLEGTKSGYFRLIANDGVNTAFLDSNRFSVEGKPPEVRISNPADANTYVYGQTVTLEGYGQDVEDGTLDDAQLTWSSDRDGVLGMGHLLYPSGLSIGTHKITLTARDSSGLAAATTVTVNISEP